MKPGKGRKPKLKKRPNPAAKELGTMFSRLAGDLAIQAALCRATPDEKLAIASFIPMLLEQVRKLPKEHISMLGNVADGIASGELSVLHCDDPDCTLCHKPIDFSGFVKPEGVQ